MENQTFGTKVKIERESRKWTRVELAQQIGTSSKTIARWERGETLPQSHLHQKLCELFDISPQELGLLVSKNPAKEQLNKELCSQVDVEIAQQSESIPIKDNHFFISMRNSYSKTQFAHAEHDHKNYIFGLSVRGFLRAWWRSIREQLFTTYFVFVKDFSALSMRLESILKYQTQDTSPIQKVAVKMTYIRAKNQELHNCNISTLIRCQIEKKHIVLKEYYKYLAIIIQLFKYKTVEEIRKEHIYQIKQKIAIYCQYAFLLCISLVLLQGLSKIYAQFQTRGLVDIMQNIIQAVLQVLSHPAWQGIGTLISLVSIIISLLPRRSIPSGRSAKKNLLEDYFYFVPSLWSFDTII